MPAITHMVRTPVRTFLGPSRSVGLASVRAPAIAENCTTRKRMIVSVCSNPKVSVAMTPAMTMIVRMPSM